VNSSMRVNRTLVVAVSGLAVVVSVALPASAGASHSATGKNGMFPSTLSPTTAHVGTKMTLKAHGAEKTTNYICVFAMVKGKRQRQDLDNATTIASSSKGTFKCTLTFKAFKAKIAGKTYHCPPTKADKKARVKCAFSAADPSNPKKSHTIQYFTAQK